jgi:ubiquinone/menaquinone biosynthesis C-methylase UbiE
MRKIFYIYSKIKNNVKNYFYLYSGKAKKRLEAELNHPERLAVLPYCTSGKGIDVGCGHRKSHENCIGVDILAKGSLGEIGCIRGKEIQADICASGDNLYMFKDGELDFVVSRHNLEHYVDPIKTLKEWSRVLKKGGILATILPDERKLNTIKLDSTHKHVFTPESYNSILELIGGFEIIKTEEVIPNWSFISVARKK